MKNRVLKAVSAFGLSLSLAAPAMAGDAPTRRINISVTEKGFDPSGIQVKTGEKVTFVFLRKTDKTCAKDVKIVVSDKETIQRKLPLDKPVEVTTSFSKAGEIAYGCSMDMVTGVITVK